MKNVAILLKGSISKINGRSNFPGSVNNSDSYINYVSGFASIKRHIVEANPEINFDFFIHTWHPDLHESLIKLYNPKDIKTESNEIYKTELTYKTISSGVDTSNFGQTSHCLSIKKGFELIEICNIDYDLIMFYRLDVLLWKDIILKNYDSKIITINNFMDCNGDFHFIMNYDNAKKFSKIYDYISNELKPIPHLLFKEYILKYMSIPIKMDDISAGIDQEVIRKLSPVVKSKRISHDTLVEYGLDIEEIYKYSYGEC